MNLHKIGAALTFFVIIPPMGSSRDQSLRDEYMIKRAALTFGLITEMGSGSSRSSIVNERAENSEKER